MSWEADVDPLRRSLERRQNQVGWVGEEADNAAERAPGQRAAAFANAVSAQQAQGDVRRRFDWRQKGRGEVQPGIVGAMNSCQKPYHLWNCERPEVGHPFQLERQPPLRFGELLETGERGMPEQLETSSRALMRWILDESFEDLVLRKDRERDRELLRAPLPFGKQDEERAMSGPLNLLAPPGAGGFSMGGPPPGSPPPGPGGFSMGGPPPGAPPPPPWERQAAPPPSPPEPPSADQDPG